MIRYAEFTLELRAVDPLTIRDLETLQRTLFSAARAAFPTLPPDGVLVEGRVLDNEEGWRQLIDSEPPCDQ